MSNLIILAIVVFVLALAAIPAAIRAQAADTVSVTGKIQFLENGKVLHDTGVQVKTVAGLATSKNVSKDDVTETVALDCTQIDVEAMNEGKALTAATGKALNTAPKTVRGLVKPSGADCTYELRLPAIDASYKVEIAVVGFAKGGEANSKVVIDGSGLGTVTPSGWNLVKNVPEGPSPSTGKLPPDSKTPTKVVLKAVTPDVVIVTDAKDAGDLKSQGTQKIVGESAPITFRAVPSTVDFSADIQ